MRQVWKRIFVMAAASACVCAVADYYAHKTLIKIKTYDEGFTAKVTYSAAGIPLRSVVTGPDGYSVGARYQDYIEVISYDMNGEIREGPVHISLTRLQ